MGRDLKPTGSIKSVIFGSGFEEGHSALADPAHDAASNTLWGLR
jgi:hypothetical protein